MARLNVEDKIYRDDRFIKLCHLIGGKRNAIGTCVLIWDSAQYWYSRSPSTLIPMEEWKKIEGNESAIKVGLAEMRDGGIYVMGTDEHCKHIRANIKNGQKGGIENQRRIRQAKSSKSSEIKPSSSSSSSKDKNHNGTHSVFERPKTVSQWEYWYALYKNEEWILSEISMARQWLKENGSNQTNPIIFVHNWLSRVWISQSKKEPDEKPKIDLSGYKTDRQLEEELGAT